MREFPSCYGKNGVQIADYASCTSVTPSKASQNLVTCIHHCKLLGKSCLISIIWSKNLMGQCFSVEVNDLSSHHQCVCKIDVKPSLFLKRKGSKYFHLNSNKVVIFWDLSLARFGSGPEPLEGYYLAMVCKGEMALAVGDLRKEAFKKVNARPPLYNPLFISKREHVFGERVYGTKAQFCDNGRIHDLTIECRSEENNDDDPRLVIGVDGKMVMQVKHLKWKFRGNYTILVDGLQVEVFWDVYNWLFDSTSFGSAVFIFQTCLSAEKFQTIQTLSDLSIMPWPSSSGSFGDAKKLPCQGFSLVLSVWKNE